MSKHGWTYKKLGDVAKVAAGQGAPQGESSYSIMGTPFVKAGNLEELVNGGSIYSIQKVNEDVVSKNRLKKYSAGSILFAKSGMSCMKGWVYMLPIDCYVVSHLAIVSAYDINPHFLSIYFRHNKPNTLVKDAAYPSISLKDIENMHVPVPTRKEQEAIVAELDEINEAIAELRQQIADLDTLAQSTFYDMFGDPVTNEKGWEVKTLKELSDKISNGNTPKGGSQVYVEEGILFLRSQNVWKNRLELDDVAYLDDETHAKMSDSSLKHNDILITKTGRVNTENSSLGRAALFTGEDDSANINGHVYLVRLKDGVLHKFILYILISESFRELIRRVCVGGIDKRQLNKNHIEDFPIIYPPLGLQQEFVEKFKAIEEAKAELNAQIAEMQTLLASRMDYYFD